MKIRKVTIQNLNSLRQQTPITIDFSQSPLVDTGLFAITGDTGAGKTTILDAITLALYGRIHRNKDVQEVMSYGAVESLAEVEFESRGALYRSKWSIWRSRKKVDGALQAPKREIARWNAEVEHFEILASKTRETDHLVEEVTGLDYDRFCRSVLLSQGDFAAFLMASEKERSDLLERITGTEIYSQLSKAAYQRHKLEAEKLGKLKKEQDALSILTDEEVATLQVDLEQQQEETKELKWKIEKIRSQRDWLQGLEKLTQRLQASEEREINILKDIADRKTDFDRLELAQKAAPLREPFLKWQETVQLKQNIEQDVQTLESIHQERTVALDKARLYLQQEKQAQEKLRGDFSQREEVYDIVKALDIRIQEKLKPLTALRHEQEELAGNLRSQREQEQEEKQQQQHIEHEQKKRRQWLSENKHLESLREKEQLIYHQYQQWKEYRVQKSMLASAGEKGTLEIQRLETEEKEMTGLLTRLQEELNEMQQSFREKIPGNFALGRNELLQLMFREIEKLTDEQQTLQKLQQLSVEYQALLAEQNVLEEKLEDLQNEELGLSKRILSATEVLRELLDREKYKKTVFEQQQLIANYEKDRHQLKEGEACPLCFSTDHPFRHQHFEPYIDRAKLEWEQARQRYEDIYRSYRDLLERHTELGLEIQHLSGSEIKALKGQLRQRYDKILGFEQKLALILPDMGVHELTGIWGQSLSERLGESVQALTRRKKNRDFLSALDRKLQEKEAAINQLREKRRENLSALRSRSEKQHSDLKQLEKWTDKEAEMQKDLEQLLHQYGYTFQPETMDETFREITALSQRFQNENKVYGEQQEEWRLNVQRLEQFSSRIKQLTFQERSLKERLGKEETGVNSLQLKRKEIFGDADPVEERRRLQSNLETQQKKVEEILEEQQGLEQEKVANQGLLQEARKRYGGLIQKVETLKTALTKLASANLFESLLALEQAMMSHEALEKLADSLQELRQKLQEVRQSKKEINLEIKEERSKAKTMLGLTELQTALTQQEILYVEANQREGALQQRLKEHKRRVNAAATLLKEIAQQEKSYLRWAKLNDIIGMADGKKFRVFAQGLTLKKLVYFANLHLERLNGRYLIEKNVKEDLDLNIIDTFQANNRRSMNTLSGGERFLVSLAMALGLSDLAGKDTRIESLFIDEGFGSLDDNSLDLALDTLENLQAQGKTIGIISHVKALKERIAIQIQVRKKGSGFSEITVST